MFVLNFLLTSSVHDSNHARKTYTCSDNNFMQAQSDQYYWSFFTQKKTISLRLNICRKKNGNFCFCLLFLTIWISLHNGRVTSNHHLQLKMNRIFVILNDNKSKHSNWLDQKHLIEYLCCNIMIVYEI